MLYLMAQADIPSWITGTGFLILIPLCAWWIWHTTAVGIPQMHQEQRLHVQQITATHAATVSNLVDEFRAENKEHRAACAAEKQLLWDQLQKVKRSNPRDSNRTEGA